MNLNPAQAEYIDRLKIDYPETDEASLRKSLEDAGWPDFEVTEALERFGFKSSSNIPESSSLVNRPVAAASQPSSIKVEPQAEVRGDFPKKSSTNPLLFGILGLLVIGGVAALGYFFYQSVFKASLGTLNDETLLPAIFAKLSEIDKTNYEVAFSLGIVPREAGAISFTETFPADEPKLLLYQRDADRIRDVEKILSTLREMGGDSIYAYPTAQKPASVTSGYPQKLSDIDLTMQDPSGVPYEYELLDKGKSFALTVTFETIEAYSHVARYATGENMTIVLGPQDYVYSGNFSGRPAAPKLFGVFALDEIEGFLPADLKAQFALGGSIDNSETATTDARLTAEGSVSFGDASFSASVEGIKKSNEFYGIVHKFPSFFSSLSQIRGQWVKFNETDLRNYGYSYFYDNFIPSEQNERQAATKKAKDEFLRVLDLASREKLVQIAAPVTREEIGEETLTRYTLRINQAAILPFLDSYYNEFRESEFALGESDYQELRTQLESPEFNQSFAYLTEQLRFSVWLDKQGYPVKFEQYIRHIPSPEARALASEQIELRLILVLKDINKPLVIEEPKDAISFDELMMSVTGVSMEEILLDRQQNNISAIQQALEEYRSWSGIYPASLSELSKVREDVPKASEQSTEEDPMWYYKESRVTLPFLRLVPTDVYTKEPYQYVVAGDDYALTYEIKFPAFSTEVNVNMYYTYGSWDMVSGSRSEPALVLSFANGENTATRDTISTARLDNTDTDKDGLANTLEEVLGTNINKADTDGDGFSDRDEIETRSNPLGPGRLGGEDGSYMF